MVDIIGLVACGSWHKICHAITPWRRCDGKLATLVLLRTDVLGAFLDVGLIKCYGL